MTCGADCPFGGGDIYACAVRYAELGFAVYPCSNSGTMAQHRMMGKFEKGMGGFKIASSDPEIVRSWKPVWQQPDVTIGMRTGAESRLIVIDFDLKPKPVGADVGSDGGAVIFGQLGELDRTPEDKFRAWARDAGVTVPGNVLVETPSGGRHIWLRSGTPGARQIRWMENIDLLWDKHSIKAPPSFRPGSDRKPSGSYSFERGCACQVPEAPEELVRAILATPATGRPSRRPHTTDGMPTGDGTGVDIETPRRVGIPIGQQNTGLWEIACSHAGRGLPPSQALEALVETVSVSEQDASWPWELDDLLDIVERAYAWKMADLASVMALASKISF
jgi:hypothetical protein